MTSNQLTSLRGELQDFVEQMQNRLGGLSQAIRKLEASTPRHESVTAVPAIEPNTRPVAPQAAMQQSFAEPTGAMPPGNIVVSQECIAGAADASQVAQPSPDNASDASARLEAIKRRLAKQIENS